MSNLLDTVGRYAFTVIGLEITIDQSTDPSVDSWQELDRVVQRWFHGYKDYFLGRISDFFFEENL